MDDFDARRASLDLVTAFVNNNKLSAGELPALLSDVFKAISGFEIQASQPVEPDRSLVATEAGAKVAPRAKTRPVEATAISVAAEESRSPVPVNAPKVPPAIKPAVSVSQSLADSTVLVSLITGEKFKMLKRHLKKHGLTEAEYRARFNLPDDYPMVAPAYADLRRGIAKKLHAKGKEVALVALHEAAPAAGAETQAVKLSSAKPASKPKARASKVVAASKRKPAPQRAPRGSLTAGGAAKAASAASRQPAENPVAVAEAPAAATRPAVASAREVVAATAAPAKPEKKRRMARQPAAEIKSEDAAMLPAPMPDTKAQAASSPSTPEPRAGKSAQVSRAPAANGEKVMAKTARTARNKLSMKFG
ncbi:MucR family transcriptional regulator [Novosphingobium flavum]|uniref:MucR family transcriptional regulator n=1 Tax=Novosphingobium flavum TaxID=1778672 RepID=A0A7X1KLZ4_9SPHN|nr:MucR family transcriptional regulator [Novosphingobium flavum]MBC2665760.1 MucR family transcriptional regulator [Novosphingobium flavum]